MACNAVLVRPPADMVEQAASRLFTRQTARRVRKPPVAARAAFHAYDVAVAEGSAAAIVFQAQPRPAAATGIAERDADSIPVPVENDGDDASTERDAVVAIDADEALAVAPPEEPGFLLGSSGGGNVQERREGYDEDSETSCMLLVFAGDNVTLDDAKRRCRALRQTYSRPIEVARELDAGRRRRR